MKASRQDRGAGLFLLSLFFFILVFGVLFAVSPRAQNYSLREKAEYERSVMRNIAESGMQKAMALLHQGKTDAGDLQEDFGEGQWRVTISPQEGKWLLHSCGYLQKSKGPEWRIDASVKIVEGKVKIVTWMERASYAKK